MQFLFDAIYYLQIERTRDSQLRLSHDASRTTYERAEEKQARVRYYFLKLN